MPKPVTGSTKDYYVRPGTNTATKYGNSGRTYTTSTTKKNTGYVQPTGNAGNVRTGGNTYAASSGVQSAAPAQSNSYNAYAEMQAAIAEANRRAEEQMRAAQEAQRRAREEAYQKAAAQQKANYDYSAGQVNNAADKALQEAYINRMLQDKNFAQTMSAQGLNGGASETTAAGMYNNYNNARNSLEDERQRQLGSLQNTYQNNMAQLEAQRASGEAASLSQYQTALANLAANNNTNLISLLQGYGATAAPIVNKRYNAVTGQWEEY